MVNLPRLAIGMDPLSKHIDESDAHLSDFRGSYTLDHEGNDRCHESSGRLKKTSLRSTQR
jgi:hypothetical protein